MFVSWCKFSAFTKIIQVDKQNRYSSFNHCHVEFYAIDIQFNVANIHLRVLFVFNVEVKSDTIDKQISTIFMHVQNHQWKWILVWISFSVIDVGDVFVVVIFKMERSFCFTPQLTCHCIFPTIPASSSSYYYCYILLVHRHFRLISISLSPFVSLCLFLSLSVLRSVSAPNWMRWINRGHESEKEAHIKIVIRPNIAQKIYHNTVHRMPNVLLSVPSSHITSYL